MDDHNKELPLWYGEQNDATSKCIECLVRFKFVESTYAAGRSFGNIKKWIQDKFSNKWRPRKTLLADTNGWMAQGRMQTSHLVAPETWKVIKNGYKLFSSEWVAAWHRTNHFLGNWQVLDRGSSRYMWHLLGWKWKQIYFIYLLGTFVIHDKWWSVYMVIAGICCPWDPLWISWNFNR